MSSGLKVRRLTKDVLTANYDDFHRVSADVSDWGRSEFVYELPNKWDLSLCVWDEMPVAYAILSRKWADRLHIHQFMVRKERRGSGVGDTLMSGLLERYSNDPVSLKVDRHNDGAIRFYSRYGFAMADVEDGNVWMWRNLGVRR